MTLKVGVVTGEASGDLLAAGLIKAIRQRIPDAQFEGVAGPEMIAAGCEAWAQSDELAVMGLIEPLRHIPRLLRLRRSLARRWIESPPDVFIGVDAPDFNMGLEKKLRKAGICTLHYVSPSIWAWRPGRVRTVAKAVDCVLCILPFEKALYDKANVNAVFVGHPKADQLSADVDVAAARSDLGLPETAEIVAMLPGSRGGEVSRLADVFAQTAARIARDRPDVHFVVPIARPDLRQCIEQAWREAGVFEISTLVDGDSLKAMSAANAVLLASGTAVLESALLGKPSAAAYRMSPFSAVLIRAFNLLKLEYVTLPNNLTPQPMVPEFIQEKADPELMAPELLDLLQNQERRAAIHESFVTLRETLAQDASERAADALLMMKDQHRVSA